MKLNILYKYDGQNTEQRNIAKHLRSTLRKKVNVISALDESIMSGVKEGEIAHEITESSFFIDEVNFCIMSLDELQIEDSVKNGHEGVKNSNFHASNTGFAKVRLPKLELMKLDGNSVDWPSLWDNFQSLIDLNENLSDVDKFSYLIASVHGLAASTISGLTLLDSNYSVATSLL